MIKSATLTGAVFLALAPTGNAVAQSNDYVIQAPGRTPTSVKPRNLEQELVIQVPGRPPLYAKPRPDGSYTIDMPGQPPKIMTRRPGGGFVIENPGRPPTFVDPGG
jgi:hypothetical protein